MQESLFVGEFESIAKAIFHDSSLPATITVHSKANLFYELYLNQKLELAVSNTKCPKRGLSAFQTDICICEMREGGIPFPRVVIEFKKNITTHDILTYSTKAGRHKKIYPCLRYGMISSGTDSIPSRFFVHNEHLDFFVAAKKYQEREALRRFAKSLLEKELEISRNLENIHFGNLKFDYYRRDIIFKNLNDT